MPEIQNSDIRRFEFDYDITLMMFFLNADEEILGRYGGRDGEDADSRQSLAGLKFAMRAAFERHEESSDRPKRNGSSRREPLIVRQLPSSRNFRGCIHCHNVREILDTEKELAGRWTLEDAWRFPPPDNLGFVLDVDRGNRITEVRQDSPAATPGLKTGDEIETLHGHRVRSFADAQYALDKAPREGSIKVVWHRQGERLEGRIQLRRGWKRSDISWRPSMQHLVASPRMRGSSLSAEERKGLGLTPKQLAYRVSRRLLPQPEAAGIRSGDIVLGFNNETLEMDLYDFYKHVRETYIVGETVTVNLIRDGKRLDRKMTLSK